MDNPISILFYLKRVKINAQGLAPIFQRITINGRRLDNSTGKFVDPDKWHSEMSKMRGTSEEARSINGHLDNLKSKILNVEKNSITHLTSNLSASEIEMLYGNRLRSRMRQMFNLVSFDLNTKDKR